MIAARDIIKAAQARGSDANDLRDAAHEVLHALDAGAKKWDRESIHRSLSRKRCGDQFKSEVMARAVEQIVCVRLGVDPGGDIARWGYISCMEAIKFRIPFCEPATFIGLVKDAHGSRAASDFADAVIELGRTR